VRFSFVIWSCTSPDSQEQSLDLERAVSELLELKRLKVVAETQQNFLS
jgi:hypothetical protein